MRERQCKTTTSVKHVPKVFECISNNVLQGVLGGREPGAGSQCVCRTSQHD